MNFSNLNFMNGDNVADLNIPWWGFLLIAAAIFVIILILPVFNHFYKKHKDKNSVNKDDYKNSKRLNERTEKLALDKKLITEEEYDKLSDAEQQNFLIYQHNLKLHKNNKEKLLGMYNGFGSKTSIRFEPTVIVLEKKDSCELCRPFENKILSLYNTSEKYTTMQQAVENGFHHLGCSHKELDYYPSDSLIAKSIYTDEEKDKNYNLKIEKFKYEDKIRNLKFQRNNNVSNLTQKEIDDKLEKVIEEYTIFLTTNNLIRNEEKEDYSSKFIDQFN